MSNVYMVVGLGFGDEGKGTIVDTLAHAHGEKLVVRFNGGAQAAHNVVLPDGRHHTFSQFGSGTFAGARTLISRFALVDPLAMFPEARHLEAVGVANPWSLVSVERDTLVTTPIHREANKMREIQRGELRHGSCGMGIGETMVYAKEYPEDALRVADLLDETLTRMKLNLLLERTQKAFAGRGSFDFEDQLEMMLDAFAAWARKVNVVNKSYLVEQLQKNDAVIFEGAQGVLLDQIFGFAPHRTYSNCTFSNADLLLAGAVYLGAKPLSVTKLGVIRTYATRHGAGPFPTEDSTLAFTEYHNTLHQWQGAFRLGTFDTVLTNYAIKCCGGVDYLAVTHADHSDHIERICIGYNPEALMPPEGISLAGLSGQSLHRAMPDVIEEVIHSHEQGRDACTYEQLRGRSIMDAIAEYVDAPIGIVSKGKTHLDKSLNLCTK